MRVEVEVDDSVFEEWAEENGYSHKDTLTEFAEAIDDVVYRQKHLGLDVAVNPLKLLCTELGIRSKYL